MLLRWKKFGELIQCDDSEIERLIGNRFTPDQIEEYIRKAHNVLKNGYKEAEAVNFKETLKEGQKTAREEFMKKAILCFLKSKRRT